MPCSLLLNGLSGTEEQAVGAPDSGVQAVRDVQDAVAVQVSDIALVAL